MTQPTTPAISDGEKLLACPFCGGKCNVLTGHATRQVWDYGAFSRVFCTKCQVRQHFHRNDDEAIAAWNTRATPTPSIPPTLVEELRPEVLAFARLMEQQLRANDHKPGWKRDLAMDLIPRLREEVEEVQEATDRLAKQIGWRDAALYLDSTREDVGRETADVANFAMMIADVCGALPQMLDAVGGEASPIPMMLWCPKCNEQHIDAPSEDWDNPPHRSHLCHACGCIWRPADVATTGIADVKTAGEADTWGWTGGDSLLPSLGKRLKAADALAERYREALAAGDAYWAASRSHAAALSRHRAETKAVFDAAALRRDRARLALTSAGKSEIGGES